MPYPIKTYIQDPSASLDYALDWSDATWLATGDSVVTSTWTADDGITIDSDSLADNIATVWVSGGTVGCSYLLVNRVTTTQGRIDEATIRIQIAER